MQSTKKYLRICLDASSLACLALEELVNDLSPHNEEKQYGRQIHVINPFSLERCSLLTNVEDLFRQTNSSVEKGFYKSLISRSPFRF